MPQVTTEPVHPEPQYLLYEDSVGQPIEFSSSTSSSASVRWSVTGPAIATWGAGARAARMPAPIEAATLRSLKASPPFFGVA